MRIMETATVSICQRMQPGQENGANDAFATTNRQNAPRAPPFIGNGKYRVCKRIGSGSFGVIHRGMFFISLYIFSYFHSFFYL